MQGNHSGAMTRRQLLARIGMTAGGAMMYQAMSSLGMAAESNFKGPLQLDGDPKGASVLILGAGLAGMSAALRVAQGRLPRAVARIQRPPWRTQLDPARR